MKQYLTMRTECVSHEQLEKVWSSIGKHEAKLSSLVELFEGSLLEIKVFIFQLCHRVYATETDGELFFKYLGYVFENNNIHISKNRNANSIGMHYRTLENKRVSEYVKIREFIFSVLYVLNSTHWRIEVKCIEDIPSCVQYIAEKRPHLFPNLAPRDNKDAAERRMQNMLGAVLSTENYAEFSKRRARESRKRKYEFSEALRIDSTKLLNVEHSARSAALYVICYDVAAHALDSVMRSEQERDCYELTMVLYDKVRATLAGATREQALDDLSPDAQLAVESIARHFLEGSGTRWPVAELLRYFENISNVLETHQSRKLDASGTASTVQAERHSDDSVIRAEYSGVRAELQSARRGMQNPVLLWFPREIDALGLFKSMITLHYLEGVIGATNLLPFFTRQGSAVLLEADEHFVITRGVVPFLCSSTSTYRKCNNSILYPMIAQAYLAPHTHRSVFYYAMRAFYNLLTSRNSMAAETLPRADPTEDDDALAAHHSLLLRILDKMQWSREEIFRRLGAPFARKGMIHRGVMYGASLQRALLSLLELTSDHSIEHATFILIMQYFFEHPKECSGAFRDMLLGINARFASNINIAAAEIDFQEMQLLYEYAADPRTSVQASELIVSAVFSNKGRVKLPGVFKASRAFERLARDTDHFAQGYAELCRIDDRESLPSLSHGEQSLVWILQFLENRKCFRRNELFLRDMDARILKLPRERIEFPASIDPSNASAVLYESDVFPVYSSDLRSGDDEETMPFPNPPPGFLESIFLYPIT